jgi:hypothetical protein
MKYERITKNLITTFIGITILGAAFYMWMSGKATQNEAMLMGGIGLIFLRTKNSLIGLPSGK